MWCSGRTLSRRHTSFQLCGSAGIRSWRRPFQEAAGKREMTSALCLTGYDIIPGKTMARNVSNGDVFCVFESTCKTSTHIAMVPSKCLLSFSHSSTFSQHPLHSEMRHVVKIHRNRSRNALMCMRNWPSSSILRKINKKMAKYKAHLIHCNQGS